jgi:V8-like Glu-specific endopeptidase
MGFLGSLLSLFICVQCTGSYHCQSKLEYKNNISCNALIENTESISNDATEPTLDFDNLLSQNTGNLVVHDVATQNTTLEDFDIDSYPKRQPITNNGDGLQSNSLIDDYSLPLSRTDNRTMVTNPKVLPYLATAKLLIRRNTGTYIGTAFLVGPNIALTVAHNVIGDPDNTGTLSFANQYELYFGFESSDEFNSDYEYFALASKTYFHINYLSTHSSSFSYDWALLELDRNIGNEIGWYHLIPNWYVINHDVYTWGYPGDKTPNNTMWEAQGNCISLNGGCINATTTVAGGQSGSPLFIDESNEFFVCGVIAFSNANGGGGAYISNFEYALVDSFFHYHNYLHMAAEIIPTDYGFADNYPTDNYTASTYRDHYLNNGFHFQTRRYRTGYIHNEYVVMSSIRRNITHAFIEYRFDNPVVAIQVEMAHWRPHDHELLTPSTGTLVIRYLSDPEAYDDFTTIRNFFFPFDNLTTDRTNPDLITQAIPYTTTFQFYTDNNMNNTNDSNRGRVCIGSLKVFTLDGEY